MGVAQADAVVDPHTVQFKEKYNTYEVNGSFGARPSLQFHPQQMLLCKRRAGLLKALLPSLSKRVFIQLLACLVSCKLTHLAISLPRDIRQ